LWGVGQRVYFLHDGRTSDLVQAIQLHASGGSGRGGRSDASDGPTANSRQSVEAPPSEANKVIANFNNLSSASQQDLLNFLRSL
jgi:CxxC motif-containing protein (DUF1111 family)